MRRLSLLAALLSAVAATTLPVSGIRDDLGRAVELPRAVRRVVTLAPNLTEIMFAVGAGASVVATDDFSDTPAAARTLPKVGGVQPSSERIVESRPDLVLAPTSSNHPVLAAALHQAAVPLYLVRTERLADVPRAMEEIGRVVVAPAAAVAARRLREAVAAQRRHRAQPPRILFVIWTAPLYVAGRETFADDLFEVAGAHNAVQSKGWPQYSMESIVAHPPDVILYPDKSVHRDQIEGFLHSAPTLQHARAIAVNENLFTRPGPRLAEAAAELNRLLDQIGRGR